MGFGAGGKVLTDTKLGGSGPAPTALELQSGTATSACQAGGFFVQRYGYRCDRCFCGLRRADNEAKLIGCHT